MGQERYILAVDKMIKMNTSLRILESTNYKKFYEHMIFVYEKPVLLFSDEGIPCFTVLKDRHIYELFEPKTNLFNNQYFMNNCFRSVENLRVVIPIDLNDICTSYNPIVLDLKDIMKQYKIKDYDQIFFDTIYDFENNYTETFLFEEFLKKMVKKEEELVL